MFSRRIAAELRVNRLTEAVGRRRAAGLPIIDLTQSNPTRAGFDYPADLLAPLAHPRGLVYSPAPLGLPEARRAVTREYMRRGIAVDPDRIALTASTSEAYSLLFKLLASPGDEILVPRPSYPLFDHLTSLEAVVARHYDLEYHGRWSIDFSSLERAISAKTRAVLVVHPNNPTGSFVGPDELDRLAALCGDCDIALIADEVFADYEIAEQSASHAAVILARDDVLVFDLGGLSKAIGLPQVKLGWVAVGGPSPAVSAALERLELVCDTYLSVSTPVQLAAAELLERGALVRAQIAERIRGNYRRIGDLIASVPSCRLLHADAGWYGVLQVPTFRPEEDLAVDLVVNEGVLAHPGYFFDFPRESFLILSLLTPQQTLTAGLDRILSSVAERA